MLAKPTFFSVLLVVLCCSGCRKNDDSGSSTPAAPVITAVSSFSNSVGDTLIISGDNFNVVASGNTVQLNGIGVNVISSTKIKVAVIIPQGLNTGNVIVSLTANSQSATYTYAFTRLPRVSTLSGTGTQGFLDGASTIAQLKFPTELTIDAGGNIYVCDAGNDRVRKITPGPTNSSVITIAGNGVRGFADGTALSASFNVPNGVAVDAVGNLFVVDQVGLRIRKITNTGTVSTFAGNGTSGFADGNGTNARFNYPFGIAVDAAGNVYVGDGANNRIRKITPTGDVTTFAGSGIKGSADATGTNASFNSPLGLAIDGPGNVYVCDGSNHKIRKISPTGVVTTIAGTGTAGSVDGAALSAQFNTPTAIAIDAGGNLFIADQLNHKIRKITPAGTVSTYAGMQTNGYVDGNASLAQFNQPSGIAIDVGGNLYVGDNQNHVIRKITP